MNKNLSRTLRENLKKNRPPGINRGSCLYTKQRGRWSKTPGGKGGRSLKRTSGNILGQHCGSGLLIVKFKEGKMLLSLDKRTGTQGGGRKNSRKRGSHTYVRSRSRFSTKRSDGQIKRELFKSVRLVKDCQQDSEERVGGVGGGGGGSSGERSSKKTRCVVEHQKSGKGWFLWADHLQPKEENLKCLCRSNTKQEESGVHTHYPEE